jgi:integrase
MAKSNDLPKGVSAQTKNGSTYWYARIGGKKRYMGKDEKGHKRAIAARAKDVARKYEGRDLAAGLDVKRSEFVTFKEMATWYMLLPSTQKLESYTTLVNRSVHVLGYFGSHLVGTIQGDHMEHYREHRRGQGGADGTVNAEIAWISMVYNKARKGRKIPADAMPGEFPLVKGKELKRVAPPPRRLITDKEYDALLDNARDVDSRDLFICAWETSMRSSEIASLKVSQVHLDEVITEVPYRVADYLEVRDSKNRELKYVPVSEKLRQVIERRIQGREPGDLVFTNENKMWSTTVIPYRMEMACKRAGVAYGDKIKEDDLGNKFRPGIVFHCIRHSRISKWVEEGWSDSHIRLASGHKDIDSYRIYVKMDAASVMTLVGGPREVRQKTKTDEIGRKSS